MKKIINTFLFLLVVCVSLFIPMVNIRLYLRILSIIIVWGIVIYFYIRNLDLFTPTLFFAINIVLCPISLYLMKKLSINIPQIYFFLSILVYLIIILSINKFRQNVTWLKIGRFDSITISLIIIMTILTGLSLLIWAIFIKKDLSEYHKFIPNIPFALVILYGISFPILNSIFEEFMARAVLFDGFQKIYQNIVIVIIGQALVFSIWHYNGFPGGIIGVILVFIWSIFLGIIRYRAKGMLPPLLAHFFADLSIVIIIFFQVILPNNI